MRVQWIDKACLVRAEAGEQFPAAFIALAEREGWGSAAITGIGGVTGVTLAYYDLPSKSYLNFSVDGIVELVQMTGNLTQRDGKPFWHCHAVVGDRQGNLRGGHLVVFDVALTVECWIHPYTSRVDREFDANLGLSLLKL